MKSGGIYIRWRDRLWQEQPDGTYLLWEETTRQWVPSTLQPPAEGGKAVATTECPNCGKRIKSSLRSCPYCDHAMPVASTPAKSTSAAAAGQTASRRRSAPSLSPAALLTALVLAAAIGVGLFLKTRADSCENWKAGVRSYTEVAVREQGLPGGLSEQELLRLNEQRFADTRPGGCE